MVWINPINTSFPSGAMSATAETQWKPHWLIVAAAVLACGIVLAAIALGRVAKYCGL
jgi:hypothetical protein